MYAVMICLCVVSNYYQNQENRGNLGFGFWFFFKLIYHKLNTWLQLCRVTSFLNLCNKDGGNTEIKTSF